MTKAIVFTRSFIILTLATVVSLIILMMLGTWQVKRLAWKEALIDRVETQIAAPPIPFKNIEAKTRDLVGTPDNPEYQPVTITGTFDHAVEIFYYATLDGKPGYHVYSPFEVKAPSLKKTLFVNRGFVPLDNKEKNSRPQSFTNGEVTFNGLFRWPDFEKPNSFTPDNDFNQNIFFWRDLSAMAILAKIDREDVYPFFVYVENDGTGNLPIGGVSIIDFPNNHLAYAVTWYGIAGTLIAVYGALLIGRIRSKRRSEISPHMKN